MDRQKVAAEIVYTVDQPVHLVLGVTGPSERADCPSLFLVSMYSDDKDEDAKLNGPKGNLDGPYSCMDPSVYLLDGRLRIVGYPVGQRASSVVIFVPEDKIASIKTESV